MQWSRRTRETSTCKNARDYWNANTRVASYGRDVLGRHRYYNTPRRHTPRRIYHIGSRASLFFLRRSLPFGPHKSSRELIIVRYVHAFVNSPSVTGENALCARAYSWEQHYDVRGCENIKYERVSVPHGTVVRAAILTMGRLNSYTSRRFDGAKRIEMCTHTIRIFFTSARRNIWLTNYVLGNFWRHDTQRTAHISYGASLGRKSSVLQPFILRTLLVYQSVVRTAKSISRKQI